MQFVSETNLVSSMQGSTSNPIGVGDDNQPSQDAHEGINLNDEEIHPNGQNTSEDFGSVDELELKPKRQRTSSVWGEFVDVTLPDGKVKVECIHCKKRLAKVGSGTTSTYKRHLVSSAKRKAYQKSQQMLNFEPIDVDIGYDKPPPLIGPDTNYDANMMRESIANEIVGTEQPFSVVENDLFVYMMKRVICCFKRHVGLQ